MLYRHWVTRDKALAMWEFQENFPQFWQLWWRDVIQTMAGRWEGKSWGWGRARRRKRKETGIESSLPFFQGAGAGREGGHTLQDQAHCHVSKSSFLLLLLLRNRKPDQTVLVLPHKTLCDGTGSVCLFSATSRFLFLFLFSSKEITFKHGSAKYTWPGEQIWEAYPCGKASHPHYIFHVGESPTTWGNDDHLH